MKENYARRQEILNSLGQELAAKLADKPLSRLLVIQRQLAQRPAVLTEEDKSRGEELKMREAVMQVLRENLDPLGAKILAPNEGGIGKVTETLIRTKKLATVICPDFETKWDQGIVTFVPGGKLQEGIGLTGEKFLRGLPFLDSLSKLVEGIEVKVFYHAAAEKVISESQENIYLVRRSANKMAGELTSRGLRFIWHVGVIDEPGFFESVERRAAEIAPALDSRQVVILNRRREKIIKMRTGLCPQEITDEVERHEAAIDIAAHEITEAHVRQRIRDEFVHLAVDSVRFAKFYSLPVIALRGGFRYEGD